MAPTLKLDEFDRVIELDEGRCPGRTDEAFFPANIPGILSLRTEAVRAWISKLERAKRWASERAAIKAEVTRAKETIDLLGMAKAITRLDALEAEIEAAAKANLAKRQKT